MKRASVFAFVSLVSLFCLHIASRREPARRRPNLGRPTTDAGRTMVVIPFENTSPTPGLEWLGESFPETFHEQLNSPSSVRSQP